jgi:hypothetical protein
VATYSSLETVKAGSAHQPMAAGISAKLWSMENIAALVEAAGTRPTK